MINGDCYKKDGSFIVQHSYEESICISLDHAAESFFTRLERAFSEFFAAYREHDEKACYILSNEIQHLQEVLRDLEYLIFVKDDGFVYHPLVYTDPQLDLLYKVTDTEFDYYPF